MVSDYVMIHKQYENNLNILKKVYKMNFNNYLIESTILYESIIQYNTILEAVAEIAEIPPSWAVEFTKFENGKGEFSKTIVKETVAIANKVSYERVIKDTFNDQQVQGLIIMNKDVPLFALIKNPKNTSSVKLMAIDPNPAKKLHRPGWTTYTAHDAKYYTVHDKYSNKDITKTNAVKALEELLILFVSNFVKGSNDDIDINDALHEIPISIKTIEIETDEEQANNTRNTNSGGRSSSDSSTHSNKAIQIFSDKYLEKLIKDIYKLIPDIEKAEKLSQDSIDGDLTKVKVTDITDKLKKLNIELENFGVEYNNKKNANASATTPDPDWEEKFANEHVAAIQRTTTA